MRSLPYRVDVQTATSSSFDGDGFLSVGVDGEADDTSLPPVEAVPPLGLFVRPADPTQGTPGNPLPGQSCTVLRLAGDNDDFAVPLTDPRVVPLIPPLSKGGVHLYEPDPSVTDLARVTLNDDGSHRVVVHAAQGKKVVVEVAGGPSIMVDGGATPPSVTVTVGGTSITVDDTNGAQLGALGGLPVLLASPAFLTWLAAVGAATMAGPPPAASATKVKAT